MKQPITTLSNAIYQAQKFNKTLPGRLRARYLKLAANISESKTNPFLYNLRFLNMKLSDFMYNEGYDFEAVHNFRVA